MAYECETCDRQFPMEKSCIQHMNALDHWAEIHCDTCPKIFRSERAAEQHMDACDHHALDFDREACNKSFGSERAAEQDMDVLRPWENYCHECERSFLNANNLRMVGTHLRNTSSTA